MKQRIADLMAKLDAMSLRERIMVFVAALAVLWVIMNTLVWKPMLLKQKTYDAELRQAKAEMLAARDEINAKLTLFAVDPDRDNKQRLDTLKKEYERIYNNLGEQQKGLVAPEKVPQLLQSVLKQNNRLVLLSLHTIDKTPRPAPVPEANGRVLGVDAVQKLFEKIHPPESASAQPSPATLLGVVAGALAGQAVNANANAAASASASASTSAAANAAASAKAEKPAEEEKGPIFRHGVAVEVEGSYLDLLEYLVALEKLPQRVYWGNLQLNVHRYPKATMSVEIYTLSLDKKWLNL